MRSDRNLRILGAVAGRVGDFLEFMAPVLFTLTVLVWAIIFKS